MRPATKQETQRYLAKKKLREDNTKAAHRENLKFFSIIFILLFTFVLVCYIIAV